MYRKALFKNKTLIINNFLFDGHLIESTI